MPKSAGLFAAALAAGFAVQPAWAQEVEDEPSAEQMIETAREAYRPPGLLRRCPQGQPGEIVVCAPDPNAYRVETPTDAAVRTGEPVADRVPRAPDVFGLPPCKSQTVCIKGGWVPPQVHLIDLSAIPHALTEEEAAMVFRAEDGPPPALNRAEASPAAAP